MNPYLLFILIVLIGEHCFELLISFLNLRCLKSDLPEEFKGYYDEEKYKSSQEYTRVKSNFNRLSSTFSLVVTLVFLLMGGFNFIDRIARNLSSIELLSGLSFAGSLFLGSMMIRLPFEIYQTFIIEDNFGFNRTSAKTFILDKTKGILLMILIGGPALAIVFWLFSKMGRYGWLCVWGALTIIQFIIMYLAPVILMPLFNKFTALEDGDLKNTIEEYARKHKFKMKGLFKMDGSRRSSKTNAFFTGFGRNRRIVLFDTLIENHSVDELLAILAHEMGHYKLKHIAKTTTYSILQSGIMLFILSLFLNNELLFAAFRMEHLSIYASLIFFGFLYAPISMILSIFMNVLSRKHEYQADVYAIETTDKQEEFIEALKKLSVHNLTNLTPHPLKVFLSYSHPPVLDRIKAIRISANE